MRGIHQVRFLQKLVKWANAATTVYDTAVEIREIMLGGGTLPDVFAVMRGGMVVGFMVDGMCKTSLGIVLKPLMAVFGLADQAGRIQEAFKSGDPVEITVSIVEMFCMVFGLTSQCFTGDTLVSTEDGLRPIEEIQAGDCVWSENTETGEKELKKVLAVSVTETDTLVHVTTGNGTEINTTENHPFYTEGKGWCAASELEEGDVLHTQDGKTETVASVETETLDEPVKVYNLEIEDSHTYYVSVNGVLVHNECVQVNDDGTFEITDWSEYPDGLPHPEGPFTVLEGDAYKKARDDANKINKKLHRMYNYLKGLHIHEVQPVKFGGSPTDIDNKVALYPQEHFQFNKFWSMVLRELEGILNE